MDAGDKRHVCYIFDNHGWPQNGWNARVFTQQFGYWCPGAKAPGYQFPQCSGNIDWKGAVWYSNITIISKNILKIITQLFIGWSRLLVVCACQKFTKCSKRRLHRGLNYKREYQCRLRQCVLLSFDASTRPSLRLSVCPSGTNWNLVGWYIIPWIRSLFKMVNSRPSLRVPWNLEIFDERLGPGMRDDITTLTFSYRLANWWEGAQHHDMA